MIILDTRLNLSMSRAGFQLQKSKLSFCVPAAMVIFSIIVLILSSITARGVRPTGISRRICISPVLSLSAVAHSITIAAQTEDNVELPWR